MITFESAAQAFARLITEAIGAEAAAHGCLIRDIYGQLRFATTEANVEQLTPRLNDIMDALGAYAAPRDEVVADVDKEDLDAFLAEPSAAIADTKLRVIDRRVAGEEWLIRPAEIVESPQRLVFYSVKGGVGRSTALAITAADLASHGHNILVIDLDLEAPGLGSMLLSREDMPDYGVVDWFAALAAGADSDDMLVDMTGPSPFTSNRAVVDVVPARGRSPGAYLAKLARAYMPGSASTSYARFGFVKKTDLLIRKLCQCRLYDAVLIDARAGLHETSGALLLGLGARALLFGTDSDQNYDDFEILFASLQDSFDPVLNGADIRDAFKMVHAKAPREQDGRKQFHQKSWDLWTDFLYDEDVPSPEHTENVFSFDLDNEDAPHYPLAIIGDESYARFNPRTDTYQLDADAYAPVFGGFLEGVRKILRLT